MLGFSNQYKYNINDDCLYLWCFQYTSIAAEAEEKAYDESLILSASVAGVTVVCTFAKRGIPQLPKIGKK